MSNRHSASIVHNVFLVLALSEPNTGPIFYDTLSHLLGVDLVVELEDIHDAVFDGFYGEGGQVPILSAQHAHRGNLGRKRRGVRSRDDEVDKSHGKPRKGKEVVITERYQLLN